MEDDQNGRQPKWKTTKIEDKVAAEIPYSFTVELPDIGR